MCYDFNVQMHLQGNGIQAKLQGGETWCEAFGALYMHRWSMEMRGGKGHRFSHVSRCGGHFQKMLANEE